MSKSTLGIALIVAGLVLAVVGFAADAIGIGRHPGMGTVQWALVVLGVVIAVVGFVLRSGGAAGGASPAAYEPRLSEPGAGEGPGEATPAASEPRSGEGHGGPQGPP